MWVEAVTFGPHGFVAVGSYGGLARSSDGIQWETKPQLLSGYDMVNIAYGNGFFLAITRFADGGSNVWTSINGADWQSRAAPTQALGNLTFGNGVFIAVTDQAQILTTSNAIDWVTYKADYNWLGSAAFRNGVFVVSVPDFDHVLTSADGLSWTLQQIADCSCTWPIQGDFTSVAFGKGLFVGTTRAGEIWSSANGRDWTLRQEGIAPVDCSIYSCNAAPLFDVVFGGGVFLAVGGNSDFGSIYGDKLSNGRIYTSLNGITWTRRPVRVSDALNFAVYGNGTFLAVGQRSKTILQSDPFPSLTISGTTNRKLLIEGPSGGIIDIEASTDPFGNWSKIDSVTLGSAPYEWHDSTPSQRRFYRAILR
jgi:hypothetical protein